MANNAKGMARARENPNMPVAGPSREPLLAASTSREPIMGPVHEKEARLRATAIKKMPVRPWLSAFLSAKVVQELGKFNSNAPKKEMAKTTMITKQRIIRRGEERRGGK